MVLFSIELMHIGVLVRNVKFRDDIIVSISFIRGDGYALKQISFGLLNNHHHSFILFFNRGFNREETSGCLSNI